MQPTQEKKTKKKKKKDKNKVIINEKLIDSLFSFLY